MQDGLGDWRIAVATTLANDVPSAYPGGPAHRAGAPVYVSSLSKHSQYNLLGFVTPHASALALSISLKSAVEGARLHSTLAVRDSVTPLGAGKTIADENLPHLYDFFEHAMISVTFALLALETYANWMISRLENASIELEWDDGHLLLQGTDIERRASISEKLGTVLPTLLNVPSPKGKHPWEGFVKLRKTRDAAIHMKSLDMFTKDRIDDDSLYYQFFNTNLTSYPSSALDMIDWFETSENGLRWLRGFRSKLSAQD